MGVVAARRSEVREVGAEIQAAATTTVARVDHMQIAGPVQQDAAQVMQSAAAEVVAVAAAATGWAGSPLIVACAGDDQGAGQIFDTSDSFGMVGRITSGPHRCVLQEVTSSPDITPERTTKLKMSRFFATIKVVHTTPIPFSITSRRYAERWASLICRRGPPEWSPPSRPARRR